MCAPTEAKPIPTPAKASGAVGRGFMYGTISLALVFTASSVQMGHFQSRRDSLGCDTMCIGSMTSARSALSLIGSAIIGRWSDSRAIDKFGGARKAFLLLGIAASALDLMISSQATSITSLWIGMIPSALFQQNFNILKALFGEYHDASASSAERAGSVGKLGMAAGLAFMMGPFASSVFLKTYDQTAIFAAFCLILSFGFVCLLPPPPKQKIDEEEKESNEESSKSKSTSFFLLSLLPDLVPAARTGPAIFIMVARVCMALSFHVFQTIWTVVLKERFHFGPTEYNRYFGFIGFAFALSQGFLAKTILKHFGNTPRERARILLIGCLALGGGRLLAYNMHNLNMVYAIFGVVNTIWTAETSKIASPQELGGLFGVMGSVESLAGIAGPVLGGALAKIRPVEGPLFAVVSLYGVVFSMVYWGYERIVAGHSVSQSKRVD
jgi:hypothetical protein